MLTDGFHNVPAGKVAMVVTHLEMTTQAPARGRAVPDGITFRNVTPDVAWYRDVIDRVGRPWLWFSRQQMTDAALLEIIGDPGVAIYTLQIDGRDEALLELDFRTPGSCEVLFFGLTSKLIGTGAGRYLMDRAIALAWEQDITRLHLHTCTLDSQQALAFYKRSGFTPVRVEVEIADDPRLSGLLPRETAPHVPLIE
jgi:GNAT superfamily N-acetyltransferase